MPWHGQAKDWTPQPVQLVSFHGFKTRMNLDAAPACCHALSLTAHSASAVALNNQPQVCPCLPVIVCLLRPGVQECHLLSSVCLQTRCPLPLVGCLLPCLCAHGMKAAQPSFVLSVSLNLPVQGSQVRAATLLGLTDMTLKELEEHGVKYLERQVKSDVRAKRYVCARVSISCAWVSMSCAKRHLCSSMYWPRQLSQLSLWSKECFYPCKDGASCGISLDTALRCNDA